MNKRGLATAVALFFACAASAQTPPKAHNSPAQKAVAAARPTGPVGLGPLRIGMTQEAIEGLGTADSIYLLEPLAPDTRNVSERPGVMRLKAHLANPFGESAIEGTFWIESGVLTGFSLGLDESSFEQAKTQITSKYGPGSTVDRRKDEQCLYRNGANFTLNSGTVTTRWSQATSETEKIMTSASLLVLAICPPRLDGPRLPAQTYRLITIEQAHNEPPKPNLF